MRQYEKTPDPRKLMTLIRELTVNQTNFLRNISLFADGYVDQNKNNFIYHAIIIFCIARPSQTTCHIEKIL